MEQQVLTYFLGCPLQIGYKNALNISQMLTTEENTKIANLKECYHIRKIAMYIEYVASHQIFGL